MLYFHKVILSHCNASFFFENIKIKFVFIVLFTYFVAEAKLASNSIILIVNVCI